MSESKTVSIERAIIPLSGRAITARVSIGGKIPIYPDVLIISDGKWLLFKSIGTRDSSFGMEDSLIEVFQRAFPQLSANAFGNLLTVFGLTLRAVVEHSEKDAKAMVAFLENVCTLLSGGYKTKKNVNQHTLRNLRGWLNSLEPVNQEGVNRLKATLRKTIAFIEALPEALPPNTASAESTNTLDAAQALRELQANAGEER